MLTNTYYYKYIIQCTLHKYFIYIFIHFIYNLYIYILFNKKKS